MNIILKSYSYFFLYYKYEIQSGKIKNIYLKDPDATNNQGYLKRSWFSNYVYRTENNHPIFQLNEKKYFLDDLEIKIELNKIGKFTYEFIFIYSEKIVLHKKYLRFSSILDLDYSDKLEFDFFFFIYDTWKTYQSDLNKINFSNS